MTETVLSVERLVVRYGSFTAVDGLDLHVGRGELLGLLGPNGAGKSSTLRVLIGQRQPSAGRVRVLGLDLARDWQAIKPYFGYVPDRENHFDEFTGVQNLTFFARLYGVDPARVGECLALVELSEAAALPVSGYSLGMRRKLLLARALLHRPRLLYLDEPTANLDVHSAELVHRILRGLVAEGVSVVLTTHNMKEVEQLCDRVAILCRGRLVALDTPLALQRRHGDQLVEVVLNDGRQLVLDLADQARRDELAAAIRAGMVARMQTRAFAFHDAFLALTGTPFH